MKIIRAVLAGFALMFFPVSVCIAGEASLGWWSFIDNFPSDIRFLASSPDGGYVGANMRNFVKIDDVGSALWTKSYLPPYIPGTNYTTWRTNNAFDFRANPGGGYTMVTDYSYPEYPYLHNPYAHDEGGLLFTTIDEDGNLIEERQMPTRLDGDGFIPEMAARLSDGGWGIAVAERKPGPHFGYYIRLAKLDAGLNRLWERIFDADTVVARNIYPDGEGGFYLAPYYWGMSSSPYAGRWVTRFDGEGNEVFRVRLPEEASGDTEYQTCFSSDNGLTLIGWHETDQGQSIISREVTRDGTAMPIRLLRGNNIQRVYVNDAKMLPDGDMVLTGSASSEFHDSTDTLTWAMRVKPEGVSGAKQVWELNISSGKNQAGSVILPVSVNRFLVGGVADPYIYTSGVFYMIEEQNTVEISIDILPGNPNNTLSPRMKGLLPVAVFSSADFDATTADLASIALEGAPAAKIRGKYQAWLRDVNRDGLKDLYLLIDVRALNLPPGENSVALTVTTSEGREFSGTDTLRMAPLKRRFNTKPLRGFGKK